MDVAVGRRHRERIGNRAIRERGQIGGNQRDPQAPGPSPSRSRPAAGRRSTDCGASLTMTDETEPRRPRPVFWLVPDDDRVDLLVAAPARSGGRRSGRGRGAAARRRSRRRRRTGAADRAPSAARSRDRGRRARPDRGRSARRHRPGSRSRRARPRPGRAPAVPWSHWIPRSQVAESSMPSSTRSGRARPRANASHGAGSRTRITGTVARAITCAAVRAEPEQRAAGRARGDHDQIAALGLGKLTSDSSARTDDELGADARRPGRGAAPVPRASARAVVDCLIARGRTARHRPHGRARPRHRRAGSRARARRRARRHSPPRDRYRR